MRHKEGCRRTRPSVRHRDRCRRIRQFVLNQEGGADVQGGVCATRRGADAHDGVCSSRKGADVHGGLCSTRKGADVQECARQGGVQTNKAEYAPQRGPQTIEQGSGAEADHLEIPQLAHCVREAQWERLRTLWARLKHLV